MARKKSPEEIIAGETKFVAFCDLLKVVVICTLIGVVVLNLFGLLQNALTANPENVKAVKGCLTAWTIAKVLLATAVAVFGGSWCIEHHRNNKQVCKNGELRHEIESTDKVCSRSGLDKIGRTPKGK